MKKTVARRAITPMTARNRPRNFPLSLENSSSGGVGSDTGARDLVSLGSGSLLVEDEVGGLPGKSSLA